MEYQDASKKNAKCIPNNQKRTETQIVSSSFVPYDSSADSAESINL